MQISIKALEEVGLKNQINKKPNQIKLTKATVGKVVDILSKNVNDMGTIMAYAAIDTLKVHLSNNKESIEDYDLIVTGDLGEYGSKTFVEELENENIMIKDKHLDCGYIIYDKNIVGVFIYKFCEVII